MSDLDTGVITLISSDDDDSTSVVKTQPVCRPRPATLVESTVEEKDGCVPPPADNTTPSGSSSLSPIGERVPK